MAGIYIHIPFCKKACHYCDFHFSTQMHQKEAMVNALLRENELRKEFLKEETVETIYFGGGTPSLLTLSEMDLIFGSLFQNFSIHPGAEITLEANPDDLNLQKIKEIKSTPINRFSIGVQSFFKDDLIWMNRSHTEDQAIQSIQLLKDFGYLNISIDLIFGFQGLTKKKWEYNLDKALGLEVPHISTYGMTIEKGTVLGHQIKNGISQEIKEEDYANQFNYLISRLSGKGYIQYEISNFAKEGYSSRHNSHYWQGIPYLGIGPSAHSYSHPFRSWNISNNTQYIQSIVEGNLPSQQEKLNEDQSYQEYILTQIRILEGIDIDQLSFRFGEKKKEEFLKSAQRFVDQGDLLVKDHHYYLSEKARVMADYITGHLV